MNVVGVGSWAYRHRSPSQSSRYSVRWAWTYARSRPVSSAGRAPSARRRTAYAVRSEAASAVGWPWVSADWNWAAPERCRPLSPGASPTGATRMLAPQPLEVIWVASAQGRSSSLSSSQARRQV